MDEDIHENSTFAYHSFNGLIKTLDHKLKKLEFVQLPGLNQAWKLLAKSWRAVQLQMVCIGNIEWEGGMG